VRRRSDDVNCDQRHTPRARAWQATAMFCTCVGSYECGACISVGCVAVGSVCRQRRRRASVAMVRGGGFVLAQVLSSTVVIDLRLAVHLHHSIRIDSLQTVISKRSATCRESASLDLHSIRFRRSLHNRSSTCRESESLDLHSTNSTRIDSLSIVDLTQIMDARNFALAADLAHSAYVRLGEEARHSREALVRNLLAQVCRSRIERKSDSWVGHSPTLCRL
jgi:hypothetical protein